MLRVTIELLPFGEEINKRTLATMLIANKAGDLESALYDVTYASNGAIVAKGHRTKRIFRDRDTFKFLRNVLNDIFGGSNDKRRKTTKH